MGTLSFDLFYIFGIRKAQRRKVTPSQSHNVLSRPPNIKPGSSSLTVVFLPLHATSVKSSWHVLPRTKSTVPGTPPWGAMLQEVPFSHLKPRREDFTGSSIALRIYVVVGFSTFLRLELRNGLFRLHYTIATRKVTALSICSWPLPAYCGDLHFLLLLFSWGQGEAPKMWVADYVKLETKQIGWPAWLSPLPWVFLKLPWY